MVVFVMLPIIGNLVSQGSNNRINELGLALAVREEIRTTVTGVIFHVARFDAGSILFCNPCQVVRVILGRCDDISTILTNHCRVGSTCRSRYMLTNIAMSTAELTGMVMVHISPNDPFGGIRGMIFMDIYVFVATDRAFSFLGTGRNSTLVILLI